MQNRAPWQEQGQEVWVEVAFMGCGFEGRGFEEPLKTFTGVLVGGGILCSPKRCAGQLGWKWWREEMLSSDVTEGIGGAHGIPGEVPSRQRLCAREHHCHLCLPSDSEYRSLPGHPAAGHAPGPEQNAHLLWRRLLSVGATRQHSSVAAGPHLGAPALSHRSPGQATVPRDSLAGRCSAWGRHIWDIWGSAAVPPGCGSGGIWVRTSSEQVRAQAAQAGGGGRAAPGAL